MCVCMDVNVCVCVCVSLLQPLPIYNHMQLSLSITNRLSKEHGTNGMIVTETEDELWQPGDLEHEDVLGREGGGGGRGGGDKQ